MRTHEKQYFRRSFGKVAAMAGAFALIAGAAHAQNNYTDAGTNVENTFTLDYEVGGNAQPTITNDTDTTIPGAVVQGTETEFAVDRLVDVNVQESAATVTVTPGATPTTGAVLTYTVTNEGNDNQSYSFSLEDVTPDDDFDETPYTITWYYDANGDGDTDDPGESGTITEVTPGTAATTAVTPDIAPDGVVTVEVSTTIDTGRTDTEEDGVILVAETRDPTDWIDPEGVLATPTAGDKTAADTDGNDADASADPENVFSDADGTSAVEATAGVGNGANPDGMHSATSTFVVASPDMAASKASSVIAPTACGAATPAPAGYYVPGACVQYVITVENQGATATADNIDVVDNLPDGLIFFSASTAGWDAAPATQPTETYPAAETDCTGPTEATGTNCEVSVAGGSLSAGQTATVTIIARVE